VDRERVAHELETAYAELDAALARESRAENIAHRRGWIAGYRAMLAQARFAVRTDDRDRPVRPIWVITSERSAQERSRSDENLSRV